MTKEELDKQTSDELFKAFLAFVLLVVLLRMDEYYDTNGFMPYAVKKVFKSENGSIF